MIEQRCPRCGAGLEGRNPYLPSYGRYECGSYANPGTETTACLRNQLDQAQELIAELERIAELEQRQNERMRDAITSVLERVGDHKHLRDADGQSVYMVWEFCRMWELLEESLERGVGGD